MNVKASLACCRVVQDVSQEYLLRVATHRYSCEGHPRQKEPILKIAVDRWAKCAEKERGYRHLNDPTAEIMATESPQNVVSGH